MSIYLLKGPEGVETYIALCGKCSGEVLISQPEKEVADFPNNNHSCHPQDGPIEESYVVTRNPRNEQKARGIPCELLLEGDYVTLVPALQEGLWPRIHTYFKHIFLPLVS